MTTEHFSVTAPSAEADISKSTGDTVNHKEEIIGLCSQKIEALNNDLLAQLGSAMKAALLSQLIVLLEPWQTVSELVVLSFVF